MQKPPKHFRLNRDSWQSRGLISWWPCLDGDEIAGIRNYVPGAPSIPYGSGSSGRPTYRETQFGRLMRSNFSEFREQIPNIPDSWSVYCRFINRTTTTGTYPIWALGSGGTGQGVQLYMASATSLRFSIVGTWFPWTGNTNIEEGDATEVLVTYDGAATEFIVYRDGDLWIGPESSYTFVQPSVKNFAISTDWASYSTGDNEIFDVRLYGRCLTAEDAKRLTQESTDLFEPIGVPRRRLVNAQTAATPIGPIGYPGARMLMQF